MVQDLLYFLVTMAVFLLAYAIASHSILYPDAPVTWETARQIIRKPYLHLYGELFLDETEDLKDCTNDASLWKNGTSERCPSETGRIVGPIMMAIYLLFSNILMLNLLIAMFSYTFNKIHERSEKIWCFQRYIMVKDYVQRPVLCPPVNVFWHIYQLFRCCLHKRTKHELSDDPFHSLNGVMQEALSRYLKRRDHLTKNAVNEEGFRNQALKGIEALNKKVDGLETKADREDEFRRHVLDQLKEMKESINNLHRKMADSRHKADEKTEP
ncbi:hypothetical protein DPMN_078672 [Dreissena polymorpha]|uniref:Ion transport domain-containing protein n=1 Tax=Dreissena polymorpha TaxID=45954 RepID=A0A9D3YSY9_DREPO|nr:hypothetical protein DPMN_078672 [Dreissena polymorpha]